MTDIVGRLNLDYLKAMGKVMHKPLWYHERGLSQTASGYGRKLTTELMVNYNNRWRRVYCCCFSNAGTLYITKGKDWIVIND